MWQLVDCLRAYRPDLDGLLVDTPPSGLLIVRNLDPTNEVLSEKWDEILSAIPDDGPPYKQALRRYLNHIRPLTPERALQTVVSGTGSASFPGEPTADRLPAVAHRAAENQLDEASALPRPSGRGDGSYAALSESMGPVPVVGDTLGKVTVYEPLRKGATEGERSVEKLPAVSTLEHNEFRFYGYGDRLPIVEESARSTFIRSGPGSVTLVENAIIVPSGVVDQFGQPVAEANWVRKNGRLHDGITKAKDIRAETSLDEDVLFLGWQYNQYGHFLLETLSRGWILRWWNPQFALSYMGLAQRIGEGQSIRSSRHSTAAEALYPAGWSNPRSTAHRPRILVRVEVFSARASC